MKKPRKTSRSSSFTGLTCRLPFKLRLLLTLLAACCYPFMAQAQADKVSLSFTNAPLKAVFESIEQQSSYRFTYNHQLVDVEKRVSINVQNQPISDVLTTLLSPNNIKYSVVGSQIVLSAAQVKESKVERNAAQHSIRLTILDEEGKPMPYVICVIKSLGLTAASDNNGKVNFSKIPAGELEVEVNFIGYEQLKQKFDVQADIAYTFNMVPTTLNLKEVTVTATKSAAGESTSSKLKRQAIDHMQATNLKDLMELIPGQITKPYNLTEKAIINLRSISESKLNAFGTAVVVDGVPMSSNVELSEAKIESISTGVDVRGIETDNVESVEVIRGIPSAEYGDLTSGAIIINSKVGRTPWEIRARFNPASFNTSLNKGFKLGEKMGTLNTSFDFARSSGEPAEKTRSFDRISGTLNHSKSFSSSFSTKTKLRISSIIDWRGQDPDEKSLGVHENTQKDITFNLSHDGRWGLNKPFARTLSYVVGLSAASKEHFEKKDVKISGIEHIISSRESGYFEVPFFYQSYVASGGSISRPLTLFAKLNNSFYFSTAALKHTIKMGVEYKYEKNSGTGQYNDDPNRPLSLGVERRRKPNEIPALNQLSAYVEDNMSMKIAGKDVKLQLGLRYSSLQPGKEEQVFSLSPRINASAKLLKWLDVRGGYGINAKTPGMLILYPEATYNDRIAGKYETGGSTAENVYLYHVNAKNVGGMKNLKNVINTKYELGFDIDLPSNRSLSLIGFIDKTKNGFTSMIWDLTTYKANYYDNTKTYVGADGKVHFDLDNPSGSSYIFTSTGKVANAGNTTTKGIELDFDFGRFDAINTSLSVSGAYMESHDWWEKIDMANPANMGTGHNDIFGQPVYPFKLEYTDNAGEAYRRRFSTMFHIVHNIPKFGLVASINLQNIWYEYIFDPNYKKTPLAWHDIDANGDIHRHEITPAMLADPTYKIHGVLLSNQIFDPKDKTPVILPIRWLVNARLSKSIAKFATFSFYVNNVLFYEPYRRNIQGGTGELTQQNTGTFNFGMELKLTL